MGSESVNTSLLVGPREPALWHKTLGSFVDEQASRYGDAPAIIAPWQSARLSYRSLADRTWAVADALLDLGLQHGDAVGVMAGNRVEYLEALLGAARIGCPVVVLNNTYTPNELQNALFTSNCKVLFIASKIGPRSMRDHVEHVQQNASTHSQAEPKSGLLQRIICFDEPIGGNGAIAIETFNSFILRSADTTRKLARQAASLVKPDDVINLQFTSGTTGAPKAAMLTSLNVLNDGRFVGNALRLTPQDIVCCPPPLFHCFGLVLGFLACFTHGSSILFSADSFDAAKVVESIISHDATVVLGVPTMFVAEMEVISKTGQKPTSLRCGLSAGSSMPAALGKRLNAEMGLDMVIIGYGMTETSPVTFITNMEDTEEQRLNSIGRIIPHTMAKVIDPEGNILARGQRGELCTAGFALQKGYLNNPAKTEEVMKKDENGILWMHTGDEVFIDDDGYAYITGRIKDMIIRGGENIFPREIEDRLIEHTDVTEASVVGLKDAKYGEIVGAFLRAAPGVKSLLSTGEVRAWVMQKLGRHKAPKHVFWVGNDGDVADFPKTGSGKHQKFLLRDIGDRLVRQTKARL